jgi:hypothetical protein
MKNNNITNLEDINKIDSIEDLNKFKFVGLSMYGNSSESGPLWIRPSALLGNKIDGWNQVVGHTHLKHPVKENGVIFLDTLPNWYMVEYLDDNNKVVESKFVESKIAL